MRACLRRRSHRNRRAPRSAATKIPPTMPPIMAPLLDFDVELELLTSPLMPGSPVFAGCGVPSDPVRVTELSVANPTRVEGSWVGVVFASGGVPVLESVVLFGVVDEDGGVEGIVELGLRDGPPGFGRLANAIAAGISRVGVTINWFKAHGGMLVVTGC